MSVVKFTYTVMDKDGDKSPVFFRANVPTNTTVSGLNGTYAKPFWDVVTNLCFGTLEGVSINIEPPWRDWNNLRSVAAVISDVEEKALFTFGTPLGNLVHMQIPTFYENYFTNSGAGKIVDLSNADILAFIALMTEGVGSGGLDAVDLHGTDISRFKTAVQWFGKL